MKTKINYNPNEAVFTTKEVLSKLSNILYVCKDDDGYWQFHGKSSETDEQDIKLVSLSEILLIDDSIIEILDMSIGDSAIRKSIDSIWMRYQKN